MKTLRIRLAAAAACVLLGTALVLSAVSDRLGTPITGRFLLGDSDTPILIGDDGTPIVLTDRTGSGLFSNLSDGDRIFVLVSPVAETYPARAGAFFCLRLSAGTPQDLPAQTLTALAGLGWLSLPPSG